MRIRWSVVDSLLKKTCSEPKQLLAWLEAAPRESKFPCNRQHLYLGKYSFIGHYEKGVELGILFIYMPAIGYGGYTIHEFWEIWRHNPGVRVVITEQFKERYKL